MPIRCIARARVLARACAVLCVVAAAGCVTHEPLSPHYEGPLELPAAVAERFAYPAAGAATDTERPRRRPRFSVREIELPAGDRLEPIVLEYYEQEKGDEPTPVVMVLPIFNGQPIITRYFARYFAQRGWAAVAIDIDRDALFEVEGVEHAIRDTLASYRRVLDWIAANPDLDAQSIGVFGVSFGGIDGVMLAALDDRVEAVVAAMAGGGLPYIAAHTRYRPVNRAIDDWLEESGVSRSAFERRLETLIDTDPLELAPYVDAERVLLVLARSDVIVPFEAQQELRSSLGNPEALYLPTGHRTSIVFFRRLRHTAYEFFARQFADHAVASGVPN